MAMSSSLLLFHDLALCKKSGEGCRQGIFHKHHGAWSAHYFAVKSKGRGFVSPKQIVVTCQSSILPVQANNIPIAKASCASMTSFDVALHGRPVLFHLVSAVGIIAFAAWGLPAILRFGRSIFLHNESGWRQSSTYFVLTSYIQPLFAWTGVALICRVVDPIILATEASQIFKQRLLNFARSLSTTLSIAYCVSRLIGQAQQYFAKSNESDDMKKMGFNFTGKAIHMAIWVAAGSLLMELFGFSTRKWVTAGGIGTVILTLSGREIFMNFLSSIMIHATRPFGVRHRIQMKINGYDISGSVEHVGWWSPTVIRGDDREAIHIPNSKLTAAVVRNLSQRTHYRIKTHFSISHLDVSKMNNILADMRKVLAKNPEVEQKKLHRRVFLETINPENQALVIMVSCFAKTSHFDEYLCVKEAILLDLLRVINHHQARLATPMCSVQRMYTKAQMENIPFGGTSDSRAGSPAEYPLLLIGSTAKVNADDEIILPTCVSEEQEPKADGSKKTSDPPPQSSSQDDSSMIHTIKTDISEDSMLSANAPEPSPGQHENLELRELNRKAGALLGSDGSVVTVSGTGSGKPDTKRPQIDSPPTKRASVEENIVLGVVLDDSKRKLPIDEDMPPDTSIPKQPKTASRNAGGIASSAKDNKDGKIPLARDISRCQV